MQRTKIAYPIEKLAIELIPCKSAQSALSAFQHKKNTDDAGATDVRG